MEQSLFLPIHILGFFPNMKYTDFLHREKPLPMPFLEPNSHIHRLYYYYYKNSL